MANGYKIFCGSANPVLAGAICKHLDRPVGEAVVKTFSDGEIWVEIHENVRGANVFVVQPTCAPANKHLFELLIMIDAFKRASADRITAVMPYYGYARQDRKVHPRTPITAKLVADLITAAGATRVVSIDLHAGQIQGFFNIPFDHLYAIPVMVPMLESIKGDDMVIVSPDTGGVERARQLARRLNCSLAIIDKRRDKPNESEVMNVIGEVRGKRAVLFDDLVDTAGTLCKAAEKLMEIGAREVMAAATHAVLSGNAIERINASPLSTLLVTDTIPTDDKCAVCPKIKVVTVSKLLANAIRRIHEETSVSSLF